MLNPISLPSQPTFNVPREVAGHQLQLTNINGQLHLATSQVLQLLGIAESTWSGHLSTRLIEVDSMGSVQPNPCYTVYETPLFYPSQPGSNRSGLTSLTRFYHPRLVFEVALRLRNVATKTDIMNWLINVGNEVVQQGFAVDQHALRNDPVVLPNIVAVTTAHNFSPPRQSIADKSNLIDWVFYHLRDSRLADGSVNFSAWSHFRRCVYNTVHMGSVGMTALQIRFTRANHNMIDFGLINFRGKKYPTKPDKLVAANFLWDDEVLLEIALFNHGFQNVMYMNRTWGQLTVHQALQLFHQGVAKHSDYLPTLTDDWQYATETPIDNIINLPDRTALKAKTQHDLRTYEELWTHRYSLTPQQIELLEWTKQQLVLENIADTDVNGNLLESAV